MYHPINHQAQANEPAKPVSSVTLKIIGPKSSYFDKNKLTINSVLADLPVHDFQVDVNTPAADIDHTFRHQREIPGVLIMQNQTLAGIISRCKYPTPAVASPPTPRPIFLNLSGRWMARPPAPTAARAWAYRLSNSLPT